MMMMMMKLQLLQLHLYNTAYTVYAQNCQRLTLQSKHTLDRQCSCHAWQTSVRRLIGGTLKVFHHLRDTFWQADTSREHSGRGSTRQHRQTRATIRCTYSTHSHAIPGSTSALKTSGLATATDTSLPYRVQYIQYTSASSSDVVMCDPLIVSRSRRPVLDQTISGSGHVTI